MNANKNPQRIFPPLSSASSSTVPPLGFSQAKSGAPQQSFRPRKSPSIRPRGLVCQHCGDADHSKWKCYEIVGYPAWWDFTKKPRKNIGGKAAVAPTCSLPQTNVTQTGHPNPEDSWLWCKKGQFVLPRLDSQGKSEIGTGTQG